MVFFKAIKPTRHYLMNHTRDMPWHEVVQVIFAASNARKKKGKYEIDSKDCYILFIIQSNVIYVINAKRK